MPPQHSRYKPQKKAVPRDGVPAMLPHLGLSDTASLDRTAQTKSRSGFQSCPRYLRSERSCGNKDKNFSKHHFDAIVFDNLSSLHESNGGFYRCCRNNCRSKYLGLRASCSNSVGSMIASEVYYHHYTSEVSPFWYIFEVRR